jgi:glucan phosphoethanolaminetransferase (alkaline phosphatase superfamily)
VLGGLLCASDSLTFKSTIVHEVYAISIFTGFFIIWRIVARLGIKILHYLLLFGYYNYLFLTYALFEVGKENLGVPMTFKMIYPYFENFSLLKNLISTSTLILAVLGYAFIIGLVFYFWNKAYRSVRQRRSTQITSRTLVFTGIPVLLVAFVFIFKFEYFQQKFNGHKINEPYLTLLFFDEAFDRQKELGDENVLESQQYKSHTGNGKNVVLIIADALRPDFFQSEEQLSPFVDSLLTADYVAHKNMYAIGSFSFNGISAILSSSKTLYEQNFFLHDVLKKQGYDINFILSGDMTNFWDLKGHITTKSVDFYTDGYESFKYGRSENLNDDQKNILDQLENLKPFNGTPTFFYFHMMSVHQIGDLKEKYKRFQPSSIDLSSSDFDPQLLVNDYKNRMLQLDDYIRKLYKTLEQKGYLEDFVFVITGDHGQSLGEDGIFFHSKFINPASVRIPLIINSKDTLDTDKVANQLNIAPTILSELDLIIPKTFEGIALSKQTPKTVFQNQGDFYAMVWEEKESIYQLFYDDSKKLYKLFDVTSSTGGDNEDILSQWEPPKIDSLKQVLKQHFQR